MMMNEHLLFHTVHQISRQLSKQLNVALEPFGLYNAQWAVLYVLKEHGTLTQKELCDYLAVEAPPMTRTIQRLTRQGYIAQHAGKDKRKKYIQLTEKALIEYPKWEEAVSEMNRKLVKTLPDPTQDKLLKLLSNWLANIKVGD
jgi:MarR family transcriptional regulator, transcriptional regulator for hemolysin